MADTGCKRGPKCAGLWHERPASRERAHAGTRMRKYMHKMADDTRKMADDTRKMAANRRRGSPGRQDERYAVNTTVVERYRGDAVV